MPPRIFGKGKSLLYSAIFLVMVVCFSICVLFGKNNLYDHSVLLNRRGHCGINVSTQFEKSVHVSYGSANLLLENFGADKDKIVLGLSDHPYLISIDNLWDCDLPSYVNINHSVLDDYTLRIREASKIVDMTNLEAEEVSDIYPFNSEYKIGDFEEKHRTGFWRRTKIIESNSSAKRPSLIAVCDYGSSIKNNTCAISISPTCFPALIFTLNGVEEIYLDQSEKIRNALDSIASRLLDHQRVSCP